MRISNRPTKTVTETSRSKTVLNKSADVLQHNVHPYISINNLIYTKKNTEYKCVKTKDSGYPEYQGTISKNLGLFFDFSVFLTGRGWVRAHLMINKINNHEKDDLVCTQDINL